MNGMHVRIDWFLPKEYLLFPPGRTVGASTLRLQREASFFREVDRLPQIPFDAKCTFLVGAGMLPIQTLRSKMLELSPVRCKRRPADLVFEDTRKIRDADALKRWVEDTARDSGLIMFLGHANPWSVKMRRNLVVNGSLLEGLSLRHRVVAFDGCNTGLTRWGNDEVAPQEHLLEAAVWHAHPLAAIGRNTQAGMSDMRLAAYLSLRGGGHVLNPSKVGQVRVLQYEDPTPPERDEWAPATPDR
jgi:hypothetical protein